MPYQYQPTDFSDVFGTGEGQLETKFAAYAPQYDDWQETYIEQAYGFAGQEYGIAQDLYGLAGERYGMAQDRSLFEQSQRGDARGQAGERLGFQLAGMGQKMGGTLSGAQEQVFDILSQGEQMGAGGLGTRSGMTRRSMRSIEGSTERALTGQAMTGLEAKSQYKSTMGDIAASAFGSAQSLAESGLAYDQAGLSLEASGIEYGRAGMEYSQSMDELAADWEDDMYDYLFMLGELTGEWYDFSDDRDTNQVTDDEETGTDNNNDGVIDAQDTLYNEDGTYKSEYDPDAETDTELNPAGNNFDQSTWGPGNPYYDHNPDLGWWQTGQATIDPNQYEEGDKPDLPDDDPDDTVTRTGP